MIESVGATRVYLESGSKRTFAGALDWPGWCRGGRDEEAALDGLMRSAVRYARALRGTRLGFRTPGDPSALAVVERLPGDATTDFGAPGAAPSEDTRPVDEADLRRFGTVLRACWRTLDAAAETARGVELRTGPRGGGRALEAILLHVQDADAGYLGRLGQRHRPDPHGDPSAELQATRAAVIDALGSAVRGGVPPVGPRGGKRWMPRYFVRRVAWHALDHAWEIEDRSASAARSR